MSYVLIGATILFTMAGQLLVKAGMLQVGEFPGQAEALPGFLLQALTNINVVGGLALAVFAALTWLGALSLTDISLAYPFMGLPIVLVLALLGGFSGLGGGPFYGTGWYGGGGLGVILVIVLILVLLQKI